MDRQMQKHMARRVESTAMTNALLAEIRGGAALLEWFGHQNVINDLKLRRAPEAPVHQSILGVGLLQGDFEIALEPCAGAFGTIRADIARIDVEEVDAVKAFKWTQP